MALSAAAVIALFQLIDKKGSKSLVIFCPVILK